MNAPAARTMHPARGAVELTRPRGSWYAWDNARWRVRQLAPLPRDVAARIAADVERIEAEQGARAANKHTGTLCGEFHNARAFAAFDEDELQWRAEIAAERCRHMGAEQAKAYAEKKGLQLPRGRQVTRTGLHHRTRAPHWWRRQLRKLYARRAENVFRQIGLVHKQAAPYVTRDGLERFEGQKRRNAEFLKGCDVVALETGELFPLAEIAAKGLANQSIRRGELMTRIRGFEEVAAEAGHVGLFVTLTCPSAFHARHVSGERNERWNGATIRGGRDWLQKMWARARAKFARLSIIVYGVRVAEPHHDGTPHWHLMLFCAPQDMRTVRRVLHMLWCAEYREEVVNRRALKARRKFVLIRPEKGTAAGYCAKYVAKNIDGYKLDGDDESELQGTEAARAIEAWSRIHGIRQFQQIGGPRVGLWRELRRVREPIAEQPRIEAIRDAADRGDWSGFIGAAGGIENCREAPVAVDKDVPRGEPDGIVGLKGGGRLGVEKPSEWGEAPMPRPVGICYTGSCERVVRVRTRQPWRRVIRGQSCTSTYGGSKSPETFGGPRHHRNRDATAGQSRNSVSETSCAWSGGDGSTHPTSSGVVCVLAWNSARTSASASFFFFFRGRVFSYLGPVGITIRSAGAPEIGALEARTGRETSQAGPQ